MYIYINDQLVRSEILPTNTPTLDETLETFSFALISNDNPIPYAPMQKVEVDFSNEDNETGYFYIVSDSVETCSLKPLRYKHNITCIQNTRELSKHLVRNSVFTQPANIIRNSYNAESQYGDPYSKDAAINFGNPNIPSLNWASEPLTLTSKEKLTNTKLKISFQYVRKNRLNGTTAVIENDIISNAHTVNDIISQFPTIASLSIPNRIILKYKNSQGVDQNPVYITPSDLDVSYFDLNKEYDFPIIEQLSKQGFKNFEIQFESLDFLTGTFNDFADTPLADAFGNPSQYPYILFYMVQVQIIGEVYYYTARDVLELLASRQTKRTSLGSKESLPFRVPYTTGNFTENQKETARLLENTIAPNFIFTQLTLYECVAEVFRLFDAIFVMDDDGYLGIEYFNDLSKGKITSSNAKFSGRTLSWGEDKYTDGLVSYYQDARYVETFPRNGDFAHLRSSEFGVPEAQDHHFIVPHNIQSIIKCEILNGAITSSAGSATSHFIAGGDFPIDITNYVVEQSVWSSLDKGSMTPTDYENRKLKQANSVYYVEGDNKIQVAYSFKDSWGLTGSNYSLYLAASTALLRMSGTNDASELLPDGYLAGYWGTIKMRLTYVATVDGVEKVHSLEKKYQGETLVDQANGAVDLNKLGLNILGLSLKLGNPTLNATHKITTWSNRIKTGQTYEWTVDGVKSIWVANVVNYTFAHGMIQGKISFVKNFNQLALRTQLLREKRMTNISKSLIQKSEDVLTDYVYFSTVAITQTGEGIHFNYNYFKQFLLDSLSVKTSYIKLGDVYTYRRLKDQTTNSTWGKYIPLHTYGAGNTINFEMSYDHPMSAGNQTQAETTWGGFNLQKQQYFTIHILYTDVYKDRWDNWVSDGFLDEARIIAPTSITSDTYFPDVEMPRNVDTYFSIIDYHVHKQPNEIFALNYQIAFLPLPGRENIDFVNVGFTNKNAFVSNLNDFPTRKLYVNFNTRKTSVLETKSDDYNFQREVLLIETTDVGDFGYILELRFTPVPDALFEEYKSWCLVDEKDNVLFASNNMQDPHYVRLYFITKRNRIS